MKNRIGRVAFSWFVFLVLVVLGENAFALGKYAGDTSAIERARLPKYCYAQYVDDALSGKPGYSIEGCGVWMNHYCPGLIHLMRAKNSKFKKNERIQYAVRAVEDIKYTLNGMTSDCSIRGDVESAMANAQATERVLKGAGGVIPGSPAVKARDNSDVAAKESGPEKHSEGVPTPPSFGDQDASGPDGLKGESADKMEYGCRFCPPDSIQRKWEESFKDGDVKH